MKASPDPEPVSPRANTERQPARILIRAEDPASALARARSIAREHSADIQRVDLSLIINDYLRETEKKMLALMDTAEESGSILFFDDAETLFSKSPASFSSAANGGRDIDAPFFLQCIENYPGMVIIAAKDPESLDPAKLAQIGFAQLQE